MHNSGPQFSGWISHTQVLLDSFRRLVGRELIGRSGDTADEAERLFFATFAVLSHGTQADPILNYANRVALELWEMTPEQLILTPSRLTAEPIEREARAALLQQTSRQGWLNGYEGVRISASGRRFLIKNATLWDLADQRGRPMGQAATFDQWSEAG